MLLIGDQRIAAHKAVLSARADFFAGTSPPPDPVSVGCVLLLAPNCHNRGAVGSSFREGQTGEIRVQELSSPAALRALVHYFYEDYLPPSATIDEVVDLCVPLRLFPEC